MVARVISDEIERRVKVHQKGEYLALDKAMRTANEHLEGRWEISCCRRENRNTVSVLFSWVDDDE